MCPVVHYHRSEQPDVGPKMHACCLWHKRSLQLQGAVSDT